MDLIILPISALCSFLAYSGVRSGGKGVGGGGTFLVNISTAHLFVCSFLSFFLLNSKFFQITVLLVHNEIGSLRLWTV